MAHKGKRDLVSDDLNAPGGARLYPCRCDRSAALPLHYLLEFESLYGELICQAFEKCALLRVARSPAHKGQIRGIDTEFVQFFS